MSYPDPQTLLLASYLLLPKEINLADRAVLLGFDSDVIEKAAFGLNQERYITHDESGHFVPSSELEPQDKAELCCYYGEYQLQRNELNDALRGFYEARLLHSALGEMPNLATDLGNIGTTLFRARQLDAAIKCFEEAKSLFLEVNEQHGVAAAEANLALIKAEQGQINEALTGLRKALEMFKNVNDAAMILQTEKNLEWLESKRSSL